MINLTISNEEYLNDLMELVRPFEARWKQDLSIDVDYKDDNGGMKIRISSDALCGFVKNYAFKVVAKDDLERKRIEKRYLKIAIYRTLSFLTGVNLPYGCLTGIRPTKLYLEIQNEQEKYAKSAREVFVKDYSVSESKVQLVEKSSTCNALCATNRARNTTCLCSFRFARQDARIARLSAFP